MRIVLSIVFVVLAFVLCTTGYAANPKAPAFAWQTATAAKVKVNAKSPSEVYAGRLAKYLAPASMTPEEQSKIDALVKASAADVDNAETHKKAIAALHASALAVLTEEQRTTLAAAHSRKSSKAAGSTKASTKGGDSSK